MKCRLLWTLIIAFTIAGCAHGPKTRDLADPTHRDLRQPTGWPGPMAQEPAPAKSPAIAIVIDDVGRSWEDIEPYVLLPISISFSVLPSLDQGPAVASQLWALGRDILAHIPMAPMESSAEDVPGFLRPGMDIGEIQRITRGHLDRVPGALGANNHMGSLLTTDKKAMGAYIQVLAERGLFALDSRTSAQTVLEDQADKAGVPTLRRHVFLDDDPSPEAIQRQVLETIRIARALGCAIAIGHPRPGTYDALSNLVKTMPEGVQFVPISRLISAPCGRRAPPPARHSPGE